MDAADKADGARADGCLIVGKEGSGAGEGCGDLICRVGLSKVAESGGGCAGVGKDGKDRTAAIADGDGEWHIDGAGSGEYDRVDVACGEKVVGCVGSRGRNGVRIYGTPAGDRGTEQGDAAKIKKRMQPSVNGSIRGVLE